MAYTVPPSHRIPKNHSVVIPTTFPSWKQIYSVPGTYIWTCPPTIYWLKATVIGAGGAGTGITGTGGGGAGGAGGFFQVYTQVIPQQQYTIVVGQGGLSGTGIAASLANGGNSSVSGIGTSFGGYNSGTNTGSTIGTFAGGLGGSYDYSASTYPAWIAFNGGYGGNGSTLGTNRGGGGGAGIVLSNGGDGLDGGSTSVYAIGGAGAGSFNSPKTVAWTATPYMVGCGGGGIGKGSCNPVPSLYGSGGASIYANGIGDLGGMGWDNDGPTANTVGAAGKGAGGSKQTLGQGNIGSGFMPSFFNQISGLPPLAQFFFSIFNTISGTASGSESNGAVAYAGVNSNCGGGTGSVGGLATGGQGGNSWICGGGGGATGNNTTVGSLYSLGGNGAGGGGGGGGAIGGNGGNGLVLLEW